MMARLRGSWTAAVTSAFGESVTGLSIKRWVSKPLVGDSTTSDRIHLRDMIFYGRHGAHPEEQVLGQKFVVNVDLHADLRTVGQSDNLEDTIDYAMAWSVVRSVVETPSSSSGSGPSPRTTIERVAEECSEKLLEKFSAVERVDVRIEKPHVAVEGVLGSLGISISRGRDGSV